MSVTITFSGSSCSIFLIYQRFNKLSRNYKQLSKIQLSLPAGFQSEFCIKSVPNFQKSRQFSRFENSCNVLHFQVTGEQKGSNFTTCFVNMRWYFIKKTSKKNFYNSSKDRNIFMTSSTHFIGRYKCTDPSFSLFFILRIEFFLLHWILGQNQLRYSQKVKPGSRTPFKWINQDLIFPWSYNWILIDWRSPNSDKK